MQTKNEHLKTRPNRSFNRSWEATLAQDYVIERNTSPPDPKAGLCSISARLKAMKEGDVVYFTSSDFKSRTDEINMDSLGQMVRRVVREKGGWFRVQRMTRATAEVEKMPSDLEARLERARVLIEQEAGSAVLKGEAKISIPIIPAALDRCASA